VRSAAEARRISRLLASGLASLIPRLQVDWPLDMKQPSIKWVGK
jgi:hypothetical protein